MQEKQINNALIWFRNDLRVHDNAVLQEAMNSGKNAIALYCFDPRHFETTLYGFKKTEKFRVKFLIESIVDLKHNLSKLNINLLTFHSKPEAVIPRLVEDYQIDGLYLQKEWTEEEVAVLEKVRGSMPKEVEIQEIYNQLLYHPEEIQMEIEQIPKVFTGFRKHLEKQCNIRQTIAIPDKASVEITSEFTVIPTLEDLGFEDFETHPKSAFPFKGGETQALKRLHSYFFETKKLGFYKKTRNELIGTDFSSKFSPWLANGSISAKMIYWEVKRFEAEHFKNDSTYWLIFELIWRDFFKYIALKHGNDIFKLGGILKNDYEWNTNSKAIKQWQNGTTVEPFVNANMIELNKTGWMSNRGRQNVASYFAKTMELDWRIGAAYFESLLIDYDVHSNYGNWMYVAGVGNDPRDRTFNVKLQAERYDAHGKYQNLWLQETLF
ncbi:deoxyribodipyrimidine photo-lyase [Gelidibacter algens]|uniref:Cryptochrome DASH n=1 Tax=Gelidibacter algens TaxID=49280 RepID=A0A1A7QWH7_9FLAO|nr:DASH family cryptochrome [Gelidibacter algens]OBX22872.1 deoxyribodipyrimidine photolyase [Gelidibacter algens]RAJ27634.1 deoxyribodipyrimidine photo-lyase [Gelidibacter algens]